MLLLIQALLRLSLLVTEEVCFFQLHFDPDCLAELSSGLVIEEGAESGDETGEHEGLAPHRAELKTIFKPLFGLQEVILSLALV
jgi:hypothetical protein